MTQDSTAKVKSETKYCPKCYGRFDFFAGETCPHDNTPLCSRENDPLIGKVFAERYEIDSLIGMGGMSVVYKAKHRLMDRIVAIKMLHNNIKNDPTSLERFRIEAQAASALSHQNIIAVYDFGVTSQGDAFFVMDFLDGESLDDLLDRKEKLPWERAVSIFKQICDGLATAHRKGIVHRDLKPANVCLIKQDDGFELVKLVDFGIAKLLPGSGKQQQNLTRTGEVFGSPIYMSPEQCEGKEQDNRSDIYALGCLMYQTLTGEPPLIGDSFLETMNKHVGEQPKPISERYPELKIPAVLDQIILRCLSKAPKDRFQTSEEIRDQLSALSASLTATGMQRGAVSGPVSTVPAAPCPPNRAASIWKYVGIGLGATLIGLMAFLYFWPGAPDDPGSPWFKTQWQFAMAQADDAIKQHNFELADRLLSEAAVTTSHFADQDGRLERTLKKKADLYSAWEGHAELLEKTNTEIVSIQIKRVKGDLQNQLEELKRLDQYPANSDVARSSARLRAEAEVPTFLATSAKLYGARLYMDQTDFLKRAIAVEKKLLGDNSVPVTRLEGNLADGLLALGKFDDVRPLLLHSCTVRKSQADVSPDDYLRALNRLGQFDLDQNDFKSAELELTEALKLAEKEKIDPAVHIACLRSYASMLHQSKRDEESKKYLKQADELESKQDGQLNFPRRM